MRNRFNIFESIKSNIDLSTFSFINVLNRCRVFPKRYISVFRHNWSKPHNRSSQKILHDTIAVNRSTSPYQHIPDTNPWQDFWVYGPSFPRNYTYKIVGSIIPTSYTKSGVLLAGAAKYIPERLSFSLFPGHTYVGNSSKWWRQLYHKNKVVGSATVELFSVKEEELSCGKLRVCRYFYSILLTDAVISGFMSSYKGDLTSEIEAVKKCEEQLNNLGFVFLNSRQESMI